jgi:hypothetical protein
MMRILLPCDSSLSHYREPEGITRGMLIACELSTTLLDELVLEKSNIRAQK